MNFTDESVVYYSEKIFILEICLKTSKVKYVNLIDYNLSFFINRWYFFITKTINVNLAEKLSKKKTFISTVHKTLSKF